jgi:hypothetical protein
MPPFIFNRMSQPLCSLPLPSPLPQIASLYLEDNVQQMLMQRYANPVAILPFTPNWQISQPTISAGPQVLQQQQQLIIPISTFHSYQVALNSGDMLIYPLQIPSAPADVSQASWIPQYCNSGHPRTYCTCIPASTSFNNSVISNSQIQNSPTYHHTPATTINPNIRPTNEQSALLLRPSATLKNVHNQIREKYEYPHMNARSHKTPPLPPGAKIMFDEYITKDDLFQKQRNSKQHQKQSQPINKTAERSTSTKINNTNENEPSKNQTLSNVAKVNNQPTKNQALSNVTKVDNDTTSHQSLVKSKSVTSACSVHNLSFNANVKTEKMIISSNNKDQNVNHEQLPAETPNINLHFDDQPRKLSPAHDIDRHLNANDKNLNSSSSDDELRDLRLSLALADDLLSSVPDSSTKGEEQSDEKTNKSMNASSSTPPLLKELETKSSTIRETIGRSSSIIKASSRDTLNSTKSKNVDWISITTRSKSDKQSDRNFSITETF